ncbi:MAG: SulP family inorganic anion transporter [Betaproteobacteria bacterium]|nr:SulP family inorganic anion transporter [Betaproteobacteria bacterium]
MSEAAPTPSQPVDAHWIADAVAGISMAGLLLPEAVAYSGLAGLPPAAGLVGLLAGLLCYSLAGRSRFAIVSSTSSSATLLGSALMALGGGAALHSALAAGLVLLTGLAFCLASAARLGSISNFISKPVLRGFAFGLALSVVIKQIGKMAGVEVQAQATPAYALELVSSLPRWNLSGLMMGLVALLALRVMERFRRLPSALIVIAAGIAAGQALVLKDHGVALVGTIDLAHLSWQLPSLSVTQWTALGELAGAMLLLLFAESYGSIRSLAIKHGDPVTANRDLAALGLGNLLSGLFQGMPVGAGYSASSANEAAGATSRRAGFVAALAVLVLLATVLPLVALTPEPVLAAVVINAMAHALSLDAFKSYFGWKRDRVVVVVAVLAVLVLGVLHGLLVAIAVSLAMTLRSQSYPVVNELARLGDSQDFIALRDRTDLHAVPGLLVLRPEASLFFANVDGVLETIRRRIIESAARSVVISLEESPDLDGTSIDALREFVAEQTGRGVRLVLARVKGPVAEVLRRSPGHPLEGQVLEIGSVDDAVRRLQV